MRQRNVRYLTRMIVKTAIILLPILICFFSVFIAKHDGSTSTVSLLFQEIAGFSEDFYNLSINAWYRTFLEIFHFEDLIYNTSYGCIILALPIYFVWVEIFDLLLHLIFFFTDLFHKFLGGDK